VGRSDRIEREAVREKVLQVEGSGVAAGLNFYSRKGGAGNCSPFAHPCFGVPGIMLNQVEISLYKYKSLERIPKN
jgi:hypothetical protein